MNNRKPCHHKGYKVYVSLFLSSVTVPQIEALLGKALIYGHSNYLLGKTYLLEVAHQPCLSDLTMAKVYQDLGEISMMEQDFKQGIFYTNKSSLLYKKDPSGEPEVLENLITLLHAYTYLDDVEKAKGYAQEAFQKLKDLKANERTKKEFEARVYSRLVTVYNYQYLHGPHGEEAEKYALKALSILGAEEFFFKTQAKPTKLLSSQVIISKAKLGKVYSMLGKYDKMYDCIQEVQYIAEHHLDNHVHNFLSADVQRFLGEFYLRHHKEQLAEETLTHAYALLTKIVDVRNIYGLLLLRTEARVKLGKFKEAYEDFLAYQTIEKPKINYITLLNATAFYHAAMIKYQVKEYSLSLQHFNEFFGEIAIFCRRFFNDQTFKEMETKGLFSKVQSIDQKGKNIEDCLKRSTDIFIAIYGREHPFVRDYVLKAFLLGLEAEDIQENRQIIKA